MQYQMPFSVSLIVNKDIVKDNCGNCQLFVNNHFFVLQAFSLGYIKNSAKQCVSWFLKKKKKVYKDTLELVRGGNT